MIEVVLLILILLIVLCFCIFKTNRISGGYGHRVLLDDESVKCINHMFRFVVRNDKSIFLPLCPSYSEFEEQLSDRFSACSCLSVLLRENSQRVKKELKQYSKYPDYEIACRVLDELETIYMESRHITISNEIDLSDFTPEEYDIMGKPFDGETGYQILNNQDNYMEIRRMDARYLKHINDLCEYYHRIDPTHRGNHVREVTKYSMTISYPYRDIIYHDKMVYGYKAVKTFELVNDFYKKRKIPLRFLFAGYELTNASAGQSGGIGMYCSPNPNVCPAYIGKHKYGIIYRYLINYDRYFYSSINTKLPENILQFITHKFTSEYANKLSPEAKMLLCILHPNVAATACYMMWQYYNEPENKKKLDDRLKSLPSYVRYREDKSDADWYFHSVDDELRSAIVSVDAFQNLLTGYTDENGIYHEPILDSKDFIRATNIMIPIYKAILIESYNTQYSDNAMEAFVNRDNWEFVNLSHAATHLGRDEVVEDFYDSMNIDLIVSNTDSAEYWRPFSMQMTRDAPVYEMVVRRGGHAIMDGMLVVSK